MDLIPDYVKRKKGLAKVKAPHKLLDGVTRETYGVLIYQEQVMQAAQVMAGYTLGGADLLRRAMGKKDKEKMAKERVKFREGCAKLHGIKAETADQVFDTLEKFAGYGFNRSHSAAYAWISYQTAYLKANYPVEFMAAVMSNEVSNTDKISVFVAECERLGIRILPPDLNLAGLKFEPAEINNEGVEALKVARKRVDPAAAADASPIATVDDHEPAGVRFAELSDEKPVKGRRKAKTAKRTPENGSAEAPPEKPRLGAIRFGLAAIKNVGESAMVAALEERTKDGPFESLENFCSRVDSRKISKKAIECLVKCGAFDFAGVERAQLFAAIDGAIAAASSAHRDRAAGQISMFDVFETAAAPTVRGTAAIPPWPQNEKLAFEKELLGFYVTGHPLDEYRPALESDRFIPIMRLAEQEDKSTVSIAGALIQIDKKFTKKESKPFAVIVVEDLTDQLEIMVWSETYLKAQQHLVLGGVVSVTGRLDLRGEGVRIAATEVKPLKKPVVEKPVVLNFDRQKTTESDLAVVHEAMITNPGNRQVEFVFRGEDGSQLRLVPDAHLRISMTEDIKTRLRPWMDG